MANSNSPIAYAIPLAPFDGEEFYAVIIPEEVQRGKLNCVWVFRKGCGMAVCHSTKLADKNDPTMTVNGIKTLDSTGEYDDNKEELLGLR